ncbi:MAG TPA: 4'-phosphopantetheinyl transferase superfamily protein [Pseudonocardiaceae bacterium]|nr:4'-phosphopantetheinyl transferase superfamily protein [Pseudonocardiaceae bacterium]
MEKTLRDTEVHIWRLALDLSAPRLTALAATLSSDERTRAAAFAFEGTRRRFIARRGQVRELLGSYLGLPAGDLEFHYGTWGKPEIAGELRLRFNVSHSDELALVALTTRYAVGVDVQRVRRLPDASRLARRFFAPAEVRTLGHIPDYRFFGCWVRKEAYIKATGRGLSLGLSRFQVSVPPSPPRVLRSDEPGRWTMFEPAALTGYTAAVAVAGTVEPSFTWHYTDVTDDQSPEDSQEATCPLE